MRTTTEARFQVSPQAGEVSALIMSPDTARALLVLAHGAGAGMRHPFMRTLSEKLADNGVATVRYQFPYTEHGSRRPDRPPVLLATVGAAVDFARGARPDLPLFAGGKSMGGRMTSLAAGTNGLPGVRGLIFFGFPLHPAGTPGIERARHLADVPLPMLFLQGTRDKLADLDLLRPVCADLGDRATLQVVDGADHSFHVLKRDGSDEDALGKLSRMVAAWCAGWR